MINYTADGLKFKVPGDWSEMTLTRFIAFTESTTDSQVLSAISGVPLEKLRPLKAPDLSNIIYDLDYLETIPDFRKAPVPKKIFIDGLAIVPPTNLGSQTCFGQKADVDYIIKEMADAGQAYNYINLSRVLLCTYLFPLITGERYEGQGQVMTILPLIDNMPAPDALSLSAFFLTSVKSQMHSGRISFSQDQKQKKALQPGKLKTWLKTSKVMIRIMQLGKSQTLTGSVR